MTLCEIFKRIAATSSWDKPRAIHRTNCSSCTRTLIDNNNGTAADMSTYLLLKFKQLFQILVDIAKNGKELSTVLFELKMIATNIIFKSVFHTIVPFFLSFTFGMKIKHYVLKLFSTFMLKFSKN